MRQIRTVIAAALLCVLGALSFVRSEVYRDEVALYSDVAAKSPNKARPHNNLGDALKKAGRYSDAGVRFERALEIQPDYPDALNNLATIYGTFGRQDEALQLLAHALSLDPGHRQARFNLAMTFYERGMLSEAEHHYAILLQTAPQSKEAAFAAKMLSLIRKKSAL